MDIYYDASVLSLEVDGFASDGKKTKIFFSTSTVIVCPNEQGFSVQFYAKCALLKLK